MVISVLHIAGGGSDTACTVAPPAPSLTAQLRALGGFDQTYDPDNRPALRSLAAQAASVVTPALIGAVPGDPVRVTASASGKPDALVIPLARTASGDGAPRVVGLVAFLRDCSGRAVFSAVDDLTSGGSPGVAQFPAVTAETAATRLGTGTPALVYASSPFAPQWRNPSSGATIPAG